MATLYTHQAENIHKTWFLMTAFLVVVIALGWLFSQAWGNPFILYIAVIFAVLMNFFSYWYSDKVVIKLAGARPASHEEFFDLYTIVENLAITAGLPLPRSGARRGRGDHWALKHFGQNRTGGRDRSRTFAYRQSRYAGLNRGGGTGWLRRYSLRYFSAVAIVWFSQW